MPVLLAALGALLVSLDSAINIALPAMATAFGVAPAAIRWVIICYLLTYAVTALAAGLLADRLGPGPVFTAGLWLCAVTFMG
ncbi:MAG: MFS transporter, partial [Candidatus Rokuibacteriota bacterium]